MIVRFTDAAIRELEDIEAYVAYDDPVAAQRLAETIVHACLTLQQSPGLGPVIAVLRGVTLRRLVSGSYLVVYSAGPDQITIHRIRHGARSPRLLLKGLHLP